MAGISGNGYRNPTSFNTGFDHAAVICAALAAVAGVLAALTIRNPEHPIVKSEPQAPDVPRPSCAALDAAPLAAEVLSKPG